MVRRIVLALALAAAVLVPALAKAASPIEGTWLWGPHHVVIAATTAGSYTGTLTAPLTVHSRFVDCTVPAGYVLWAITGTASPYKLTETMPGGMENQSCDQAGVTAIGHLIPGTSSGKSVLFLCTARPGNPIPPLGVNCVTLERFGAAPAATTTAQPPRGSAAISYIVAAGKNAKLTGAGQYSYVSPTFDRAKKNNYPNTAKLSGEVYLGDGGATATYTITKLAPTPRVFSLWIYYSDDGLHASGDRTVVITIPKLGKTIKWSNRSQDTKGWKAVKVGTLTTSGNITISFRKAASTPAAFIMNAFALTTSTATPAFR